jgi:excisionase family DNA binding protein
MPKRFLSINGVVKFLGISRPTVYRFIEKGMPNYKVGRRRFFDADELIEWVKSHRGDPLPKAVGKPQNTDGKEK